jgi:predicted DNA-binding protein YlxM (UPF0122 family)
MKKLFINTQETQICKQYVVDKLSTNELAKLHGCNHLTIRNTIIRNGYTLRIPSEALKGHKVSKKTKQKIREKTKKVMEDPKIREKISKANSTPEAIQQSLKNGYGIKCYYKDEFFPSKFEKEGFLKLVKLGFEVEHNFLGRFDAKAKKRNREFVVEFHMFYKGKDRNGLTNKQYYNQRRKLLDKYGYKDLKLIVIKDLKEIENKLLER